VSFSVPFKSYVIPFTYCAPLVQIVNIHNINVFFLKKKKDNHTNTNFVDICDVYKICQINQHLLTIHR